MPSPTRTVLITGSSTGIGRATAMHFQQQGWNVAATMRTPAKENALGALRGVFCCALDVGDGASVAAAVDAVIRTFGGIDVLVNNAGYGLTGPFEGTTEEQIQRQFNTNVFGLMRVTKAVLPFFRKRRSGTIVNVASMGGRIVFPYYSIYHGTKWAVEGFSESLCHELEPLGIRVRIVEPGVIRTDFYGRSNDSTTSAAPADYLEHANLAFRNMQPAPAGGTRPETVAKVIYRAAVSGSRRLRYPVGPDARLLLLLRRLLPDALFARMIGRAVFRKG